MKTRTLLMLAVWFAVLCTARAAEPQILTVAIFDFTSTDEGMRDLGPKIATLLNAHLSATDNIITVERADLAKILGEQELGQSGTVSPDTAAKVGHLTGAKVLVTGSVFQLDKRITIVAKIIGTETSRVFGEIAEGAAGASVADLTDELSKKISKTVKEQGGTLVAKVETPEERIARIKKSVAGKTLPSVSVKIAEQHFGAHVIDPAVQTELALILKDCGFKIVDDQSPDKAEVEITGEAFSELGMRKGNFISCKARVELKAHNRAGDVLVVDRQTSVAVDLSEQIAGKTALQNAAAELAERIAAKLVK